MNWLEHSGRPIHLLHHVSAIGKGNFKTGEKLIEENEETSYLNEGIIIIIVCSGNVL